MSELTKPVDALDESKRLTDGELFTRLHDLVRADRRLSARLLVHLGELDARGLYRELAFASMFDYAVRALHLSESEAFVRIRAARVCRLFPRVLELLAAGELHLSAIKLLGPVLTADNHQQLLEQARCKSKREVELLLAREFPQPDVPSVIRKLPAVPLPQAAAQPRPSNVANAHGTAPQPEQTTSANPGRSEPAATPKHATLAAPPTFHLAPPAVTAPALPLSPGRYKVQFTADQRLHDKLEQARALLRHQLPDGDLSALVERAVDMLIAARMKERFGRVGRPRAQTRPSRSRHIPHAVRRAVIERDGQQCSCVSGDGRRCQERGRLEFDHRMPYAHGGAATADNVRLLCRVHNVLQAEAAFGPAFVRRRITEARLSRRGLDAAVGGEREG